mmetsp:Transcript_28736/g.80323  ORF Transcript_28736/g.80323 Transcript_28736/m.80323 type:complete len:204 (-) Transcript_28736:476-1087(-)
MLRFFFPHPALPPPVAPPPSERSAADFRNSASSKFSNSMAMECSVWPFRNRLESSSQVYSRMLGSFSTRCRTKSRSPAATAWRACFRLSTVVLPTLDEASAVAITVSNDLRLASLMICRISPSSSHSEAMASVSSSSSFAHSIWSKMNLTASVCMDRIANWRGVWFLFEDLTLRSAPQSNSALSAAIFPFMAAWCNGLSPLSF